MLQSTGVYMRRAKKEAAQRMPDQWVALKRMWELAFSAKCSSRLPSGVSKCVFCAGGDHDEGDGLDAADDGVVDEDGRLFCCALCSTAWHTKCCDLFMRFARSRITTMDEYTQSLNFVPDIFHDDSKLDEFGSCLGLA